MKESNVSTSATTDSATIVAAVNSFLDELRSYAEREDLVDLAAFLLYASYVSRNAETLSIDLAPEFSVDEARARLGNDYVAHEFLDAYGNLTSPLCMLPRVQLELKGRVDLQRIILSWVDVLGSSNLPLDETESFDIAHTIAFALENIYSSGGGRTASEHSSYAPIAKLVVRLADVNGKDVLDPACGFGSFLAEAVFAGASMLYGGDLAQHAIQRAKILCFFADPLASVSLEVKDSLLGKAEGRFDRIVCTPPFATRITRSDIDTYARVATPLADGIAPSSSHGEDYFVGNALASLNEHGIAVLHLSPSFLFHQQKARREFRQALVSQGHITAVIELPGGCVPGSSVNSAIVILSKTPSEEDVLLINAASGALEGKGYFDQARRSCAPTEAGIERLTEIVRNRQEIPSVSILVPRERIVATDADLCYATYGHVYTENDQLRPTSDILAAIKEHRLRAKRLDVRISMILSTLEGAVTTAQK